MSSTQTVAIYALMIVAGFVIPIMASLNAGLGGKIQSPFAAVSVLTIVAATTAFVVASLNGGIPIDRFAATPKHLFLGGVCFIVYISSVTFMAPKIGLANAIFFVLLGQMMSATMIDHFGLFGAIKSEVTFKRIFGLAVMALGVYIARADVAG